MKRFSSSFCIAHKGSDANDFCSQYLKARSRVLFIGTVGFDSNSLYFPRLLSAFPNLQYRFVVERRPNVSADLLKIGDDHKSELSSFLSASSLKFCDVDIVAKDGATVAGRNAVTTAKSWFAEDFSDIVIDATGMSRGTCFPVVRQALEFAAQRTIDVHLLVASSRERSLPVRGESNDRSDWMHGFQGSMGIDRSEGDLKLWMPQLTENASHAMTAIYKELSPVAEVCPIVPFPSFKPRRGDDLVFEYKDLLEGDWDCNAMNIVSAHESDPMDVFQTIVRVHTARQEAFAGAKSRAVTILSPAGWRIGSLGMLLAAMDLNLPILYVETIGYVCELSSALPAQPAVEPDDLWHLWLAGVPYSS